MTREEFFAKLNLRLSVLNEKERKDIIEEYTSHIDFKIADGKTEAQAIADFGNIDALAAEILEAYHIDNNVAKSKNLEYYIRVCVDFVNRVTEHILSLSLSDLARLVVEFILVIFIIMLLSVPVDMIISPVAHTFYSTNLGGISELLGNIVLLLGDLANLSIAFLIVYSFIRTRVLSKAPVMPKFKAEHSDFYKNGTENTQYNDSFNSSEANFDSVTGKPLKKKKTLGDVGKSSGDFIIKMCVVVLKLFLFTCVWLPGVFCSIGLIVASVLLVVLMTQGIGLWGICLIVIGCGVISIGVTAWVTEAIFGGKKANEK